MEPARAERRASLGADLLQPGGEKGAPVDVQQAFQPCTHLCCEPPSRPCLVIRPEGFGCLWLRETFFPQPSV
jgi:hypothetical protein